MAESLLTVNQVSEELQLTKDQVGALVKQGALRGFLDAGTYKFRRSDVEKYKKTVQSSATVLFEAPSTKAGKSESDITDIKPKGTSKIDLTEIEGDVGADESDQTTVLPPVAGKGGAGKGEADAVFAFAEDEVGLSADEKSGASDDTSKVDLADIDADAGVEESDQTTVLPPVAGKGDAATAEADAVFAFSEDEVGLAADEKAGASDDASKVDLADIEADENADESDQTSVLAPVDEETDAGKAEEDAVFEFSEDELGLSLDDEQPAESVLVADESESSLDILEVTEESSSDSATSTADFDFMEESSSSEEVASVAEVAEETPSEEVRQAEDAPEEDTPIAIAIDGDASSGETVSDILGSGEEISDEELETLDLDEVIETQETALDEETPAAAPVGGMETTTVEVEPLAAAGGVAVEGPPTDTAETMPLGDESETVGIAQEDATRMVGEEAPEELEEEAELAAAGSVAAGWELVTPSALGNALLILAIINTAVAGVFVLSEMTDSTNVITDVFAQHIMPLVTKMGL